MEEKRKETKETVMLGKFDGREVLMRKRWFIYLFLEKKKEGEEWRSEEERENLEQRCGRIKKTKYLSQKLFVGNRTSRFEQSYTIY